MTPFVRRALLAVEKVIPPTLSHPEGWLRFTVTAVQVILVVALARALAGLTLALLLGPSLPSASSPAAGTATDPRRAAVSRPVDDAAIGSWHLFGQVETGRPVQAPPAPMPVTPLNLRLVGIFFMERGGNRALALIADGNGPERGYRIGESLPGGARLQRIQRDHVVVSRGGREEVLNLPKLGEVIPAAPEFVPPGAPPALENAEPPASMEPGVIDASAVAERLRGEVMTRPQALEDIAFASPYVQNGQFVGFRLRQGRDHRLLRQLGLNSGDVITEVNGSRLSSPAQGLTLLQEMLSADQISVRVLRNGAEIPLTFSLSGQLPR